MSERILKVEEVEKVYKYWLNNVKEDELLKELQDIKMCPQEINERFYKNLNFGTAGLRGILGAGTNRMNIYTVRKASQGLANYLKSNYDNPKIVVSYDSRKNSKLFAFETAKVMAGNNIKSYITKEIQPTPFLSFAVRNLCAVGGIMITASHNPPEYNGYKCYGKDGAQLDENVAYEVYKKIDEVDVFRDIKIAEFDKAINEELILFVGDEVYKSYLDCVINQRVNIFSLKDLRVTYTPLNGSGNYSVQKVLRECGLKELQVVGCQEYPDENFTTCPYPNPEIFDTYLEAKKLAYLKNSDIILATDPDSDRVGICVKHNDDYNLLSGNEIGILICDYLLSQKSKLGILSEKAIIVKTIVSTLMVNEIAHDYGCEILEVLTGFKNIASEILKLESSNREKDFLFGFEESNGYLTGTYVRDKDAVSASLLLCEISLYYKKLGMTLIDALDKLKFKYGFFKEKTLSYEFKNKEGTQKIKNIMENLRNSFQKYFLSKKLEKVEDYLNSKVFNVEDNSFVKKDLPLSDVLVFYFDKSNKIVVRPSGTEPKIKFYLMVKKDNKEDADAEIENLKSYIDKLIGNINF